MPELLGGAEASQNGFGERMPAKLILRSAIHHQPFMDRTRSKLAILHGHHRGGSAARADAISSGINPGQTGFKIGAHLDETFFSFEVEQGRERWFLLPGGFNNLVRWKKELRSAERLRRRTPRGIRRS